MNLYLIRHGLSEGNINNQVYYDMPDWKVPLADEGREQAKEVAKELKKIFNYHINIITSPYLRAKETSEIIASEFNTSTIIESPLIYEREWGNLREEVKYFKAREERTHLFDFFRRPVGGESFADLYKRAFVFFEWLKSARKNGDIWHNIIIVSHGEFLKVLLMIIDGNTVEEFNKLSNIKNCDIITREIHI